MTTRMLRVIAIVAALASLIAQRRVRSDMAMTGEISLRGRVLSVGGVKEKVLASACASCWKEWEDMEIKVINEYRLNFLDPEHRATLQRACLEFLTLSA